MLNVITIRPEYARLRMKFTKPDGTKGIMYNHDHYHLLRTALALGATQILISDVH